MQNAKQIKVDGPDIFASLYIINPTRHFAPRPGFFTFFIFHFTYFFPFREEIKT